MTIHYQRAIDKLNRKIVNLSILVEENLHRAVQALDKRDRDLALKAIDEDDQIDDMEVEVEEECLKILALHQPVAVDLRFLVAVLKINNDLERVGDLAVNVAERAAFLATQKPVDLAFDFVKMAEKSQGMLRKALDALVNENPELARKVFILDDEVDAMNRDMYQLVQDGIVRNIEAMPSLIHLLSVSRHLERIGDLATNIAEDVIYMTTGEIIRHKVEEYVQVHEGLEAAKKSP